MVAFQDQSGVRGAPTVIILGSKRLCQLSLYCFLASNLFISCLVNGRILSVFFLYGECIVKLHNGTPLLRFQGLALGDYFSDYYAMYIHFFE